MTINISPNKVFATMLAIITVLSVLHIGQLAIYYQVGDEDIFDFVDLLDFDIEANLPSMYSAFAIAFCAILLWFISVDKRRKSERGSYHWVGLTVIFAFLSLDEAISLHEEIGDFAENFVDASGVLYFAWVVPYGILMGIFVLSYFRFVFQLPTEFMVRFVLAGGIFVGGAIGLELLSAREADLYGTKSLDYSIIYTCEEIMEMLGIAIFAHALLKYIALYTGPITLRVLRPKTGLSTE